jgi:hypothetical protein
MAVADIINKQISYRTTRVAALAQLYVKGFSQSRELIPSSGGVVEKVEHKL